MAFMVAAGEEVDLFEEIYADPDMKTAIDAWMAKHYPGYEIMVELNRLRRRWPKRSA